MPVPHAKHKAQSGFGFGNIQYEGGLMITPTELLWLYVISALNEEKSPVSGGQIKWCDDYPSEWGKRPFNQNSLLFGQSR